MTEHKEIGRGMPKSFKNKVWTDGNFCYTDLSKRPSVIERDYWYYIVLVEEIELQNWETMVTVMNGKDVLVCNN